MGHRRKLFVAAAQTHRTQNSSKATFQIFMKLVHVFRVEGVFPFVTDTPSLADCSSDLVARDATFQ